MGLGQLIRRDAEGAPSKPGRIEAVDILSSERGRSGITQTMQALHEDRVGACDCHEVKGERVVDVAFPFLFFLLSGRERRGGSLSLGKTPATIP